jgi:hypothetical protein
MLGCHARRRSTTKDQTHSGNHEDSKQHSIFQTAASILAGFKHPLIIGFERHMPAAMDHLPRAETSSDSDIPIIALGIGLSTTICMQESFW